MALGPGLMCSVLAYPSCRVPVEILGGDADIVVVNAIHGYRAAAMMPMASYRCLPGIGHMLHHFVHGNVVEAVRRIASKS